VKRIQPSTALEVQPNIAAKVRCGALELLQHAKPASRSYVHDLKLTPKIVSVLPADVASSPEAQTALASSIAARRSLEAHDPHLKAKPGPTPNSLEITEGDRQSYVVIEPLAWGDFDGDSVEDMLVSVTNGASEVSVLAGRIMVLTRDEANAVLRVVKAW
jgi:hypothetical protein